MANYHFTEQVKFHPYVGQNYGNRKTKVLILGESHYGALGTEKSEFTANVVNDWLNGEKQPFFDNVVRALFGNNENPREKFEQLAFYNFLQAFKGKKARDSSFLRKEHIYDAEKPFYEVLQTLSPDVILCCGHQLWADAPWGDVEHDDQLPNSANEKPLWRRVYCKKAGLTTPALMYKLLHPSSGGFSHSKYHAMLKTIPELSEYTTQQ
jgi:hypothetical protein